MIGFGHIAEPDFYTHFPAMLPRSSRPRAAWGTGVYPSKQYFDIKMRCLRFSCAARKAKRRQILVLFRRIFRFSFCTSHEIQHFCASDVVVATLVRYVNLKFGFLPFVVASIVAMVFLRRICSSRPGDGEQRGQSLAALTARGRGLDCFQPQPRQPVLCAGRTLCVQTDWAA